MTSPVPGPHILTLRIDAESEHFFNELRARYFPPERNYLKAHLTLFHQLPDVRAYLSALQIVPFGMQATGLFNLGGGVAYRLESSPLRGLHRQLSDEFSEALIPQDKQPFRAHITIQNKVDPMEAKQLLTELQSNFKPFDVQATGLDLWTYLGGPWRHEVYYPFVG